MLFEQAPSTQPAALSRKSAQCWIPPDGVNLVQRDLQKGEFNYKIPTKFAALPCPACRGDIVISAAQGASTVHTGLLEAPSSQSSLL